MSQARYIFHHFNKCGGTTIQEYLKNYYDFDKVCFLANFCDQNTHIKKLQSDFEYLSYNFLHDPYGLNLEKRGNFFTFCFMRDPINRLYSNWKMIARWTDQEIENKSDEFREARNIAKSGFNLYLQDTSNELITAGKYNHYCYHLLYERGDLKNKFFDPKSWNEKSFIETCTQEAMNNLKEIDYIGIFEDFDTSFLIMDYYLGLPPPLALQPLNVHGRTDYRNDLDKETLELAMKVSEIDQLLYEYALKNYNERKRQLGISAHSKTVKMIQKNYEKKLNRSHEPVKKSLTISMGEALKGSGWQAREINNDRKTRWIGPESRAYLDFFIQKKDNVELKIFITNCMDDAQIDNFSATINQHPVHLRKIDSNGFRAVLSGIISKQYLNSEKNYWFWNNRYNRLLFDTGFVRKPDNPSDQRLLGVEIEKIELVPIIGSS